MPKILLYNWKELKNWLKNEAKITKQNWYVWVTFIGAVAGIIGLFVSIQGLKSEVKQVQKSQNEVQQSVEEIQKEIAEVKYDFPKVFNEQEIYTNNMEGGRLVRAYYDYLRNEDYETACSLLSTRLCSMYDYAQATKWVQDTKNRLTVKLRDAEVLNKVWFSGKKLENTGSELWCGQIKYRINYESADVTQVNQYTIATRPDGKKEIRRILCEGASKNGTATNLGGTCFSQSQECISTEPVTN